MVASPNSIHALCCDPETATQLLEFQFSLFKKIETTTRMTIPFCTEINCGNACEEASSMLTAITNVVVVWKAVHTLGFCTLSDHICLGHKFASAQWPSTKYVLPQEVL